MAYKSCYADAEFTLTDTLGTTPEIPVGEFEAGAIHLPAGAGTNNLVFHSAPSEGGTYVAAHDASGNAVSISSTTASKAYSIPAAAIDGRNWIKIVLSSDSSLAGVKITFN